MTQVLAIGEIMLELSDIGDDCYKKSYAGDTFNVAHYLNVVTQGQIKADYLTAVGTDRDSDKCLQFLQQRGVSSTRCQRDPEHTIGLFILSNDDSGEKQYGYWRSQSAARSLFDQPQDLSGYDLIYLSGITAAITLDRDNLLDSIRNAHQQGAKITYDFNHRQLLWTVQQASDFADVLLASVDIAKISDEELEFIYPLTHTKWTNGFFRTS